MQRLLRARLHDFTRLSARDKALDHSRLSKTGSRLPDDVHEKVFSFVLKLAADHGLEKTSG